MERVEIIRGVQIRDLLPRQLSRETQLNEGLDNLFVKSGATDANK